MVEPVSGGNASNIKDPTILDAGTLEWWQGKYVELLDHLKHLVSIGKAQQAYKEIPLAMSWAQNYTTNGQNVVVSNKANFNSVIGQYINAIEADFDQYAGGDTTETYARDATYAQEQIDRLVKKYPEYADDLNDLTEQINHIFSGGTGTTPEEIATWWASLWKVPDPAADAPAYSGTTPVTNAINAARSDVESQNTVLNSQMQTYAKNASRYLAFQQDCYRAIMNMIKSPVTASKNAGS